MASLVRRIDVIGFFSIALKTRSKLQRALFLASSTTSSTIPSPLTTLHPLNIILAQPQSRPAIRANIRPTSANRTLPLPTAAPRSSTRATSSLRTETFQNNAVLLRFCAALVFPLASFRHHTLPERNRHAILVQVRFFASQVADAHV